MLRLLFWRVLGLLAVLLALALGGWLLDGGLGATLRGTVSAASGGALHGAGTSAAAPTGSTVTGSTGSAAALRRSGAGDNADGSSASTGGPATSPGTAAPPETTAARSGRQAVESLPAALSAEAGTVWGWAPGGFSPARLLAVAILLLGGLLAITRSCARRRREYVRLRVQTYRTDKASAEAVVAMFEALHKRLLRRWWRRLLQGQPSVALEVHHAARHGLAGGHMPGRRRGDGAGGAADGLPELPARGGAAAARVGPGRAAA